MAEWHLSMDVAERLTERQIYILATAYLARKQFEAKLIWTALGESLGKGKAGGGELMSIGALSRMGFKIEGT
jgi:hypothetical protein